MSLKNGAIISFVVSMAILLIGGHYAMDKVPPYPKTVTVAGEVLLDGDLIKEGQKVYQKYGLMDHGSIWGHGSLRGMDFSATTLHLLGQYMREFYAMESGKTYADLTPAEKAAADQATIQGIKTNTFRTESGELVLSPAHRYAFQKLQTYWDKEFGQGNPEYGFMPGTVKTPSEREAIGAFFFWTSWAAGVLRMDNNSTFTSNWPPDISVGNTMSSDAFIWSILSIVALFVVLGLMVYLVHRYRILYGDVKGVSTAEALTRMPLTNSQYKAAKFFLVVILLFIVQLCLGGVLAHYTVHPGTFYIDLIAQKVPYSLAKTWHLQLAIFWIATAWIGTSIFLAPLISGREPKGQGLLVNLLFTAVILVAVGSLVGEALSITGILQKSWYIFGHQGWEYLELGRFWQYLLFAGLIFWLLIVYRALKSRLFGPIKDKSGLVAFYTLSAIFIVGFFGFGFFYGPDTHLSIADYWRWFVVHLWVEGIFEFFGVAVIALFLVTLGLVTKESAMKVAYFTAILVFMSGIIGTAHHYYWYGGPAYWLALGAVFSSLEPIPLIMLVVRAWMEYRSIEHQGKEYPYRWPLLFLVASSFWNFLGAGVFGFLINLPIVNYFEHGTYLTANHGHAALFGVYGMLSIALLLFTWRSLMKNEHWDNGLLRISFWGLNGGLALMTLTVLFPVGIMQLASAYLDGVWLARSAEFYNRPLVQILGQWRIVPDAIIIVFGAVPLLIFLLKTFPKLKKVGFKDGEDIYKGEKGVL